ncbi:MAG: hypothetical protein EBQ83_01710 [Burkholderiaceae bacterium]|nr:hypothetical protein [Burkholderiaceae bacterium]
MKLLSNSICPSVIALAILATGCGSGSSDTSSPAAITYTTINSSTPATNSTSLTGIRGVSNSSNVYITGGAVTSSNVWSNQLYVGPITGGGTYYTLNVPGSNSTTNAYSADNWSGNQVEVVGSSTINGISRGFLYQGPVANNNGVGTVGTAPWYDITYTSGGTVYPSIPHSVMNNIAVGGYQAGGVTAYICDITAPATPVCNNMNSIFPSTTLSSSAYGVWWNGGNSYTITGGYSTALYTDLTTPNPVGSEAFIVDYNSSTKTYSNFMSYSWKNDTTGIYSSHFEGITADLVKGGYNLPGEGILANGTMSVGFVHIARTSTGGFNPVATWIQVTYPGSTTTTADTVYQNNLLGVYKPGAQALNGYVANIPISLY